MERFLSNFTKTEFLTSNYIRERVALICVLQFATLLRQSGVECRKGEKKAPLLLTMIIYSHQFIISCYNSNKSTFKRPSFFSRRINTLVQWCISKYILRSWTSVFFITTQCVSGAHKNLCLPTSIIFLLSFVRKKKTSKYLCVPDHTCQKQFNL